MAENPDAAESAHGTAAILIARTSAEAAGFAERIANSPALAALAPGGAGALALETAGLGFPERGAAPVGFFQFRHSGLFDVVLVDERVRLFPGGWADAFVARLAGLVRPGGRVALPVATGRRRPGRLDSDDVARRLGPRVGTPEEPFGLFRADAPTASVPERPSTLGWYLADGAALVLEHALGLGGAAATDPLLSACLDPATVASLQPGMPRAEHAPVALAPVLSTHNYLLHGVSYKAPILAHIIAEHLPGRRDLRLVDIGGGFGALAAELLLTPEAGIASALVRDIAVQNVALARSLYLGLHGDLAGRFRFSLGSAETFGFGEGFDVISYIGSLLYVPKDRLHDTLTATWAGLRPGGILVVHENIKAPAFHRDYAVMFEPEELDGLLGAFGPVSHYLSTAPLLVSAADAGRRTVFRAVQKAAS